MNFKLSNFVHAINKKDHKKFNTNFAHLFINFHTFYVLKFNVGQDQQYRPVKCLFSYHY